MRRTVFVIEDDPSTCELYAFWLQNLDFDARVFTSAGAALRALAAEKPVAVCLDLGLPDRPGLDVLGDIKKRLPHLPVIVLTGDDDARSGVTAIKAGAHDYLVKPIAPDHFDAAVLTAVQRHDLELEVRELRSRLAGQALGQGMVGQSPPMLRLATQIGTVFDTDVPVLLQGETGTGKELVARTVHSNSGRSRGPFVPVNCGAIPKTLQESHFFGHERGSFTGADRQRRGFFEEAHNGTIFLDEIGELTLDAQVTLLRVLEEGTVRRVGGDREIPVSVRVISATHRDLRSMVDNGEFREDLYFRLVVYPIDLPPLRERFGDIPLLTGHFLRQFAKSMGLAVPDVTDNALRALSTHGWPGNVRELQNAIQYALLASRGNAIEIEHLPPSVSARGGPVASAAANPDVVHLRDPISGNVRTFAEIEHDVLRKARDLAGGNVSRTAQLLELGRATIYRKLGPAGRDERRKNA
jgi:DNA-binding NtrC family response regulator